MLDLLGHKDEKRFLERLARSGKMPHALLFAGPPGVGKRKLAIEFAADVLSQRGSWAQHQTAEDVQALVRKNSFPDFHALVKEESARDLSVEAVRGLCDALMLKPYYGGHRVAIIDNAERLSLGASNALLKTLEEPPANTILILITHAPHRLPSTIISRCQLLHFTHLQTTDVKRIVDALVAHCGANSKITSDLLALTEDSLSGLQLDEYLDLATGMPIEEKLDELKTHLENVCQTVAGYRRSIERLGTGEPTPGFVAQTCSGLLSKKNDMTLLRRLIRQQLRSRLRQNPSAKNASSLRLFLETERLVDERSANAELQFTSALIEAYC